MGRPRAGTALHGSPQRPARPDPQQGRETFASEPYGERFGRGFAVARRKGLVLSAGARGLHGFAVAP